MMEEQSSLHSPKAKISKSRSSLSISMNESGNDLNDIMDKLSSDHSDQLNCEFESHLNIDSVKEANAYYNANMKHREKIPSQIKGISSAFCDHLIDQFSTELKEEHKSVSIVKTGFLDYNNKPGISSSTQKEILTANKLIMELNADQGDKRVIGLRKKYEEEDSLDVNVNRDGNNESDSLIQSSDRDNDENKRKNKKDKRQVKPKVSII